MTQTLPSPKELQAKLIDLAQRFETLAEFPVPESPELESGEWVPVPSPSPLQQKASRDQRRIFDTTADEAGRLLIDLWTFGVVNDHRLAELVAAHELETWGPLVRTPANLLALFIGHSPAELQNPDGSIVEFEVIWDGTKKPTSEAPASLLAKTCTVLKLPTPISRERCSRYAQCCRELAEQIGKNANAGETGLAVGPSKTQTGDDRKHWTQPELDAEIRRYRDENGQRYAELREATAAGSETAKKSARDLFGRNKIAKRLACPRAMVSHSKVWQGIRDDLRLGKEKSGPPRGKRIGMEMAEEHWAESHSEPVVEQLSKEEIIEQIRRETHLPPEIADATIDQLERGALSADEAHARIKTYLQEHPCKTTQSMGSPNAS